MASRPGDVPCGTLDVHLRTRSEVKDHDPTPGLPHDVGGLDIPMKQSSLMNSGQRSAKTLSDDRCFLRAHGSFVSNNLFECLAAHEVHPDADLAVDFTRTVHGDDVLVSHAGEQLSFPHNRGGL